MEVLSKRSPLVESLVAGEEVPSSVTDFSRVNLHQVEKVLLLEGVVVLSLQDVILVLQEQFCLVAADPQRAFECFRAVGTHRFVRVFVCVAAELRGS